MPRYVPVSQATVPENRRSVAERAAVEAAAALGIPTPRIVWWKESGSGPQRPTAYGWVTSYADRLAAEINLVADVPLSALRGIVYHEARHVWQDRTNRFFGDRAAAENDAEAWAYQKTGYLGWPYYAR